MCQPMQFDNVQLSVGAALERQLSQTEYLRQTKTKTKERMFLKMYQFELWEEFKLYQCLLYYRLGAGEDRRINQLPP